MNLLDIIILIPIAWGVYKGFSKGFIQETSQIVALVLGVLSGLYLSKWIGGYIATHLNINEQQTNLIAFIVAFIAALALVFLVANIVERVVKNLQIGIINRLIGAVFASFKYVFILSILINLINTADRNSTIISTENKNNSLLYTPISSVAPFILPLIMDILPNKNENIIENNFNKDQND